MNTNDVYFFLPFIFKDAAVLPKLTAAIDKESSWEQLHIHHKYMFKYVTDKISGNGNAHRRCFSYRLRDEARSRFDILSAQEPYYLNITRKREELSMAFYLKDVQMHCFGTSVGIMAFRLCFADNDPQVIATAEYYLKKISRQEVSDRIRSESITLLDMAKAVTRPFYTVSAFDFFYFSNSGQERANIFTYIQVEDKDDYREELYRLRHCYSPSFIYHEDVDHADKEVYRAAPGIHWGITSETAVCLVCPEKDDEEFIRGVFTDNINKQYVFMYIWLLHQRYVLYMFLSKIGVGTLNNLHVLEKYKEQLYDFETNYVFSCVTEVPQYQVLYNRINDAMELKVMYEDVHEPLTALSECKRLKQEKFLNAVLAMLSLLTLISVFADIIGLSQGVYDWFTVDMSPYLLAFQIGGIAAVIAAMLIIIFKRKD